MSENLLKEPAALHYSTFSPPSHDYCVRTGVSVNVRRQFWWVRKHFLGVYRLT